MIMRRLGNVCVFICQSLLYCIASYVLIINLSIWISSY